MCPWDSLRRTSLPFCEPDVCGWLVHPAETISCAAYLVVALLLWWCSDAEARSFRLHWVPPITSVIGVVSALFHASMSELLAAADLAVIFLFPILLLCLHLECAGRLPADRFVTVFVLVTLGTAIPPFLHPAFRFTGLTVLGLAVLWSARLVPSRAGDRRLGVALAVLLPGVALLVLDHRGIACTSGSRAHVIQPHVLWHVLSAVSLLLFVRFEQEFLSSARRSNAALLNV